MTKLCKKCGQRKSLDAFGIDRFSPCGRRYECKACRSIHEKLLYEKSKDKHERRVRKYKDANRERVRASGREYYWENKEKYLEYKKNNIDRIREWARAGRERNREYIRLYARTYYRKNRQHLFRLRKKSLSFRITHNLRSRIGSVLKGKNKSARTMELLGCDFLNFRKHLESKFKPGMNWSNYGRGWHIDHIHPCSRFDLSKSDEQKKCFHYSNMQPLWAEENLKKSNKMVAICQ
jgi:hypothetical protein